MKWMDLGRDTGIPWLEKVCDRHIESCYNYPNRTRATGCEKCPLPSVATFFKTLKKQSLELFDLRLTQLSWYPRNVMALLSISNFALLGLAYITFKIVYQIVYYRFFHPLAKFPGPFWGSVTRLWIAYHNVKADEPEVVRALHQKYGKFRPKLKGVPSRSSQLVGSI